LVQCFMPEVIVRHFASALHFASDVTYNCQQS
jgi:hypothetical protein